MYLEFNVINLYFALTCNLQTSTILLVVFMFHWTRAVATHIMKKRHKYLWIVANYKYLGTTQTHQICVHEKIKIKLKSRNSCYHSAHNFLSSHLLAKNI